MCVSKDIRFSSNYIGCMSLSSYKDHFFQTSFALNTVSKDGSMVLVKEAVRINEKAQNISLLNISHRLFSTI